VTHSVMGVVGFSLCLLLLTTPITVCVTEEVVIEIIEVDAPDALEKTTSIITITFLPRPLSFRPSHPLTKSYTNEPGVFLFPFGSFVLGFVKRMGEGRVGASD